MESFPPIARTAMVGFQTTNGSGVTFWQMKDNPPVSGGIEIANGNGDIAQDEKLVLLDASQTLQAKTSVGSVTAYPASYYDDLTTEGQ